MVAILAMVAKVVVMISVGCDSCGVERGNSGGGGGIRSQEMCSVVLEVGSCRQVTWFGPQCACSLVGKEA